MLAAPTRSSRLSRAVVMPRDHGEHERQDGGAEGGEGDAADLAGSMTRPKAKKNTAAKASRSGQHELAHPRRHRGAGEHQAGHERADGVGDAELFGDAPATSSARPTNSTTRSSSSRAPSSSPTTGPPKRATSASTIRKPSARAKSSAASPARVGVAEHRREGRQVEGEEEVLDHDDPEDQRGLGVGEPPQLDQDLGHDGRRRDADDAGDDERLLVAPTEREAEGQARRRR